MILVRLATVRLHPALVAGMLTAGLLGGVHIGAERADHSRAPWDRLAGATCTAFQVLADDTHWPVSAEYVDTCEHLNDGPAPDMDGCTGALIAAATLRTVLREVDGLEADEPYAGLFLTALAIHEELELLRKRRGCPDAIAT